MGILNKESLDDAFGKIKKATSDFLSIVSEDNSAVDKKYSCFCTNCGTGLATNEKFCHNCGTAAVAHAKAETEQPPAIPKESEPETIKRNETERKQEYAGSVVKCPNCGEVLPAFAASCSSCGYEIRGNSAADSVKELYNSLNKAETTSQKDSIIRNFPIPNSKEDILEFMILASSNILGEDNRDIYEAWLAKFEQVYQKSLLLFREDKDFSKIQQIYDNCQINIDTEKQRKINKFTIDTIIRNITVGIGLVLMFVAVIIDRSGGNASLMELISYIVLIASASSLVKRGAIMVDYIVCAAGGGVAVALSFLLDNNSMGQLCGAIVLIIVAVNYFKSINKKQY